MNPRKQRFYIAAAGLLAVIALAWSLIGSPVVLWHNHQLKAALTGLTDTTITLEQAVPFSWDEAYTLAPYTSAEEIQQTLGAARLHLKEAASARMPQLAFLDEVAVPAAGRAAPPPPGHRRARRGAAGGSLPAKLTHGENVSFAVERAGGIVRLTPQ